MPRVSEGSLVLGDFTPSRESFAGGWAQRRTDLGRETERLRPVTLGGEPQGLVDPLLLRVDQGHVRRHHPGEGVFAEQGPGPPSGSACPVARSLEHIALPMPRLTLVIVSVVITCVPLAASFGCWDGLFLWLLVL